jgi:hypothetical protein
MGKLKADWQKTDIPKHVKIQLWLAMKDNTTHTSWQQAVARIAFEESDKWYVSTTYDTYKALKQEIESMPREEIDTLPDELRAWIYSIRKGLKSEEKVKKQPKEVISVPQFMKHLDELAKTSKILTHHASRMLRYKSDDDIETSGNITMVLRFWRKSTGQPVTETIDPLAELQYAKQHRVDSYLLKCLFAHYEDRFGKLPFAHWEKVTIENVAQTLLDNLVILSYSENLSFCPSCPSCKAIKED